MPQKILCPKEIYRQSIAYYWISDLINNKNDNKIGSKDGYRTKACFKKKTSDKFDERIDKLYKIRPFRRIMDTDMKKIYPEWTPEL